MQMVINVHIRRSKLETVLLILHLGGPEVHTRKMRHYVPAVLSSQKCTKKINLFPNNVIISSQCLLNSTRMLAINFY